MKSRNKTPWTREVHFTKTNWTFGFWSYKKGVNHRRGLDCGPLEIIWSRKVRTNVIPFTRKPPVDDISQRRDDLKAVRDLHREQERTRLR